MSCNNGNGGQSSWSGCTGGQGGPSGYAQPKAYMQVPGQGGSGSLVPLQIPYQMGPSGSVNPMCQFGCEPMTFKLTAPPGAGANGQPICFQLDPSIWLGAAQRKC